MAARWESANPALPPDMLGNPSAFLPGTFEPRLVLGLDSGCGDQPQCVNVPSRPLGANADEFEQRPPGTDASFNEAVCVMSVPSAALVGSGPEEVLAHETGHWVDCHAAPGFGTSNQPNRCPMDGPCDDPCMEDSTDEAPAVTETIANVIASWLLRSVGPYDFESCSVLRNLASSSQSPHSETCFDTINNDWDFGYLERFPCGDLGLSNVECDKPSEPAAYSASNPNPTGWCARSPGYGVYSVMQPMWELMHARSCSTSGPPYTCATVPLPQGVDPAALAIEAFLYGVRTNPMTYQQLLDATATKVACEYGPKVYDAFNAIVCHHGWRECDAPMPTVCETCGNGIREGGEECDGSDFSGPSCADLGIPGEVMGCDPLCTLVCVEEATDETGASMSGGSMTTTTTTTTTNATDPSESAGTGSGAGDDGGDGCECRHAPLGGGASAWLWLALAGLRRREHQA